MKLTDTINKASVTTEPVDSSVDHIAEPAEGPEESITAVTQLNTTEDMDGDAKKAQPYGHNRRVNNYGNHNIQHSMLLMHQRYISWVQCK